MGNSCTATAGSPEASYPFDRPGTIVRFMRPLPHSGPLETRFTDLRVHGGLSCGSYSVEDHDRIAVGE